MRRGSHSVPGVRINFLTEAQDETQDGAKRAHSRSVNFTESIRVFQPHWFDTHHLSCPMVRLSTYAVVNLAAVANSVCPRQKTAELKGLDVDLVSARA